MYNEISIFMSCPRCGQFAEMTVDLYFGLRDQSAFKIGDICPWAINKAVSNGGRPPGGNIDGEGYTECPICEKDFFVVVEVRNDLFISARSDPTKPPMIE